MGVLNVAIADDNERMVEILDSIVKKDNDIKQKYINNLATLYIEKTKQICYNSGTFGSHYYFV